MSINARAIEMTESHLSSIPTDISLKEVPPLNRRRMVAFFNCYMMKMTDFLNGLAVRCEEVILETEKQLRVIDVRLQILEHKLAGIAGEAPTRQSVRAEDVATSQVPPETPSLTEESHNQNEKAPELPEATSVPPLSPKDGNVLVKDDPMFAKYFKMLRLGVPQPAVKLKMQAEGVEPSYLDTPDALSPNEVSTHSDAEEASDSAQSDISFSDSD